ncbi:uncharacterized protein K489DRAFT_104189 [Dissoconium aciculare CBS 342.82]|uniref:Altered inheritance of mitochondria protein 21 n=1 Tax=Dissoconium aciculare CBS 342.82 TaxID=1314786 RepID=A0A6J3MEI7_9PEZI|nr:uncharacterized protein K489DRAFT_104189 [Dissoconium aciculare CBS 342.82]KAF1826024.1 hypothetical protein K489DRAFT_104189 [Dissoconium aciculare CBS 342.82]
MSTPNIPPRPQRTQASAAAAHDETPVIPPRPVRKVDPSPDREAYSRSPFNILPGAVSRPPPSPARAEADVPRRPPSVALPSIGQEGSEYSSYDQLPADALEAQKGLEADGQTKSVSADLPMHQPTASVSQSAATRQIQTVTRTDSASAAAAGIGRQSSSDHAAAEAGSVPLTRTTSNTAGGRRPSSTEPHPLRARASFNRSTASLHPQERTTSRPPSAHGDYHGIPEIGRQIPLYKNAGDVQAPSPSLNQTQHAPGIGFFNDGSSPRNHTRKRSTRQEFGPPDSYGIRHDHERQDKFERDWQAKHPEEAAKEGYHLHVPRPPTALTSEQLQKLVDQTNPGSGNSRDAAGTPDMDDVLDATDEYNSRQGPTQPGLGNNATASRAISEAGDDHILHVSRSAKRSSRISVGSTEHALEHIDRGYGSDRDLPILAADEVVKRPSSAFMHAAVDRLDANGDEYYESDQGHAADDRRNSGQHGSRPSSLHGAVLHRYNSHEEQNNKHLAEIEEYDPLFPDDDDGKARPKKTQAAGRSDLAHMHQFPSRDVWEDTPDSLQYSAEVSTPDLEREEPILDAAPTAATFETPEAEARRREKNPDDMLSDNKTFIKPRFRPGSREPHDRAGAKRFPSSDVWEDTPDSMYLETTVGGPQEEDAAGGPQEQGPGSGSDAVAASRLAQDVTPEALDDRIASGSANIGDKSRPTVPARPVRPTRQDEAPATKPKPAVPARPSGDKIGGIRGNANFLSDLNNRLKLGPQGPPARKEPSEAETAAAEETAKAPLADARKGRAKGPVRRKAPTATTELKSASFALSPLITVWSIDEEDELQVDSDPVPAPSATTTEQAEPAVIPDLEAEIVEKAQGDAVSAA